MFSLYSHYIIILTLYFLFFLFNDTATTEIYTLSLHDALPISRIHFDHDHSPVVRMDRELNVRAARLNTDLADDRERGVAHQDRKSTRLNSSHRTISYAVFCLKKKKKNHKKYNTKKTKVHTSIT